MRVCKGMNGIAGVPAEAIAASGPAQSFVRDTGAVRSPSTTSDRDRFDALYREQFDALVRLAVLLVDDRADARDLVHEAFAKWYVRRDSVRDPAVYLRTVLVNLTRARIRRSVISRKYAPRLGAAALQQAEDQPTDHLLDIIGRLPLRQRSAVVLRYYEGRTEADIASILDCRPGTVKSLLSRALAAMRIELSTDSSPDLP